MGIPLPQLPLSLPWKPPLPTSFSLSQLPSCPYVSLPTFSFLPFLTHSTLCPRKLWPLHGAQPAQELLSALPCAARLGWAGCQYLACLELWLTGASVCLDLSMLSQASPPPHLPSCTGTSKAGSVPLLLFRVAGHCLSHHVQGLSDSVLLPEGWLSPSTRKLADSGMEGQAISPPGGSQWPFTYPSLW